MDLAVANISLWRWEPGDRENPNNQYLRGCRFEPLPRGWYCQVRAHLGFDAEWQYWMQEHCPSGQFDLQWNSGDPYYWVYIENDHEAELFRLRWS
jgi:hypothetical protein